MRLARIIGTVTLVRQHPTFQGACLRVAVPLSLANLTGETSEIAEELVLYDELGAGLGSLIAFSEGGEAAQPFRPNYKPVDAYNAALIDNLDIRPLSDL